MGNPGGPGQPGGITIGDIIEKSRTLMAQFNSSGRFPDNILLDNANLAKHQVMLQVRWPEWTYSFTAQGGANIFGLPKEGVVSVLRVYFSGVQCAPSTQNILQGTNYGEYGGTQSPTFQPDWTLASQTGIGIAKISSRPAQSLSLPYFVGQPPTWFLKAGTDLVVLPFPNAGDTIAFDAYPMLPEYDELTDVTPFPAFFTEALAMRSLMYAFFEQGPVGQASLNMASVAYMEQIKLLNTWKRTLVEDIPDPLILHNSPRTYFTGPFRGPQGSMSRMGG